MERIRQAIERARADKVSAKPEIVENLEPPRRQNVTQAATALRHEEVRISPAQLQSSRIVAHDGADQRARPYDMLRTQILQSMALNDWKILGVTSPTPDCGKTLTAINLALCIARQPNQSVALVDMDLRKPQLADCLGLTATDGGVSGVLNKQAALTDIIVPVRAGNQRIAVLPAVHARDSSELMGSSATRTLLQDLRSSFQIIILDLPPVLSSDDVIALLPNLDCMLLVAAVGHSKTGEVEEAIRHLQPIPIVRLLLNKAAAAGSNYNYY
jgi:protein-tyrosine kinase